MVLINGYVYTVDDQDTVAQAVAVKDSKIVYVGDTKTAVTMVGAKTRSSTYAASCCCPASSTRTRTQA